MRSSKHHCALRFPHSHSSFPKVIYGVPHIISHAFNSGETRSHIPAHSMWHKQAFVFTRLGLLMVFLTRCALTSPNPLQVDYPLCDKDLFGTPKMEDCYQAMFWIPYINRPAKDTPDARAPRIFAEPQFLVPPFKAVKNPYAPKAIVQLPKIWKHGMSNQMRSQPHESQRLTCCISHWRQHF